jgi:hypothetical protein
MNTIATNYSFIRLIYPYEEPRDHFLFLHQMEHHFQVINQRLDHDQIEQHNVEVLKIQKYLILFISKNSCNILSPSFVLTSICAPFSSNNRTIFSLPHFDATCNGVIFCYKKKKSPNINYIHSSLADRYTLIKLRSVLSYRHCVI